MENNRGTVSHFAGIIRVVAFIVLIAIVAFFAIRWVRARQDAGGSSQSALSTENGGSANPSEDTEDENSESNQAHNDDTSSMEATGQNNEQVEGPAEDGATTEIPRVGSHSTVAMTITLGILIYTLMRCSASYKVIHRAGK